MNERLREIDGHLQIAPAHRVLYLEGKTDVDVFFALLGVARPLGDLHDGVAVRGLKDGGSGSREVVARVAAAAQAGRPHVYGVLDGDGRDLRDDERVLRDRGLLFVWKGYAIENLLVRAGWPPDFPTCPDWSDVMRRYSGLVALNRVLSSFQDSLRVAGFVQFLRPDDDGSSLDRDSVRETMERVTFVLKADHLSAFDREADAFEKLVESDLDAAHERLDGKWLVRHYVGGGLKVRGYRDRWIAHVAASGGLPEVRALWDRVRPGA